MRQNEHRQRNVDPRSCCRSLGVLAVRLYQQLIRTAERGLKPVIGVAGPGELSGADSGREG